MSARAPQGWALDLETALPIYPRLPGDHASGRLLADLYAALLIFAAVIRRRPLASVGEAMAGELERTQPDRARALRALLRRDVQLAHLLREAHTCLLEAVVGGQRIGVCLGRLLALMPDAADEVEDGVAGWEEFARATLGLMTGFGFLRPQDQADPSHSTAVRCWEGWVQWIHARPSGAEAHSDVEQPSGEKGRAHHFAQLLEALCARQAALHDLPLLYAQLARRSPPLALSELMVLVLLRGALRPLEVEDVRGLPLAKVAATWGHLGGAGRGLGDGLERLGLEARRSANPFALGLIQHPVRFDISNERVRPLYGSTLAGNRDDLRWIGELIQVWSGARSDPKLEARSFPDVPELRFAAALAHALHETVDNFAVRVMPSLAGFRHFRGPLCAWLRTEGAKMLAVEVPPGSSAAELPFAPWRARPRSGGDPLSVSRLYIELFRALERDRLSDLLSLAAWRVEPEAQSLLPSLRALLRGFVTDHAESGWFRQALHREQGLRWPGEPEAEVYEETRRPPAGQAPSASATLACGRCAALRRALEQRAQGEAPGTALDWSGPSLAVAVDRVHRVFHVGELAGACAVCAAKLLPLAAEATLTLEETLWRGLAEKPALVGLDELIQALVRSVQRYHALHHAPQDAPSHVAQEAPQRPSVASLALSLYLTPSELRLSGALDGQAREARGGAPTASLAPGLVRAGARAFARAPDETLGRLLGSALGELALQGAPGRLLAEARGAARARGERLDLYLHLDPTHAALPWELLRDPDPQGRFLAWEEDLGLVRALARPSLPPAPRAPRVPVLLVTSGLPSDIVQQEVARIGAKGAAPRVILNASAADLNAALDEHPCAVLHLACHGEPGRLFLEGGAIDGQGLAERVAGRVSVACVVNACLGARPGREDLPGQDWTGVATALLDAGVPHVVALASPLRHADALAIASAWHRAYVETDAPIAASAAARRALRARGGMSFALLQHFSLARGGQ